MAGLCGVMLTCCPESWDLLFLVEFFCILLKYRLCKRMILGRLTTAHDFQSCVILNDNAALCRLLPSCFVIITVSLTSAGRRKWFCLLDSLHAWLFEFLGQRHAIMLGDHCHAVRGSVVAFPFLVSQNLMMAVCHSKLWLGCPRYLIKSNYA